MGGAASTRDLVHDSRADEVWTMNWNYLYDWVPRIDRLFEMHKVWMLAATNKPEYVKPRRHWHWLTSGVKDYPIYMLGDIPVVPSCVAFPLADVINDIFGDRLIKGADPIDFFTSSVDYMLALAIYERWDVIELYGVEMGSNTEYRYQREGVHFFTGVAVARGIRVEIPQNSVLFRTKRYGYDGSQMIFRQDLERLLVHWIGVRDNLLGNMQKLEGTLQTLNDNGAPDAEIMPTAHKYREERDKLAIAIGHVQSLEYLIREIDLEEPELDLINPLVFTYEQFEVNNDVPAAQGAPGAMDKL